MPDPISGLTNMGATVPAADDKLVVVDKDDTSQAPAGTTKRWEWLDFLRELFKTRFGVDAGSTDAYVAALTPAPAAYLEGEHYRFKANTANTGPCTVNFNGLGAKTIKKAAGGVTTDLADNDIRAGQWVDLVYDGTNMQMQSQLGNAAAAGPATQIDETSGPTTLDIGAIADGEFLKRVGTNVVGALAGGSIDAFDFKASVRAATTANITLSGEQTIDGVAVVTGDRVLVKNQTTGSQNGIYVCDSGAWSRSTDADVSAEVTAGMFVPVAEGTTNADTFWLLTTNDPITLGTTALSFSQIGASVGINPTSLFVPYNNAGTFADSRIKRAAADVTELNGGLNTPQTFSVYKTDNGSGTFTRLKLFDNSGVWEILSDSNSNGQNLQFGVAGAAVRLQLATNHFRPTVDRGYDLGGSSQRWNQAFVFKLIINGDGLLFQSGPLLVSGGGGWLQITDSGGSENLTRISMGDPGAAGVSLTKPASQTYIEARDGNNSNYVGFRAKTLRVEPVTFANLPASPVEGMTATVTDSDTATWGATIAGGGSNRVLAYYNGTNWTVAAK